MYTSMYNRVCMYAHVRCGGKKESIPRTQPREGEYLVVCKSDKPENGRGG